MAGVTTRYYNLTGGLNTLQGIGTINQTPKRTETPHSYNVELHKLGGIKTMGGNRQLGNTLTATVTLGHEYVKGSNKYLMVCTADGKVWQYNKVTQNYEEIYQFPTPTRRHSAVNFNQGVIFTNGVDDLVYYQYGRNELQDGTVTLEDNSAVVVGTGTRFTTLSTGDHITFENIPGEYVIQSVDSDTQITLTEPVDIESQTKTYYAWELDGTTYYTDTTDNNASNITVYTYSGGVMRPSGVTGSIASDNLNITTKGSTTTTKTVIDYYAFTANVNTGYSSVCQVNGYIYCKPNTKNGNNLYARPTASVISGVLSTTTFPKATSASQLSTPTKITFQSGTKATLTAYGVSNGRPTGFSFNGNTSERVGKLTYSSSDNITHTVQETTTTNVTKIYTRVEASDVSVEIGLTDVAMYLAPISELNAVYINSDDESVREEVRGLAINTWQGRIFVGGNDGTLYYSEVGLIHGWDLKYGAGGIPRFYNDNSDFTALGLYGEYLVIHRRDYTYYLSPGYGSGTPDEWQLVPFADISCDSQQSWLSVGSGYYLYSRLNQGIYPLMKRTVFINNYLGNELSQKITEEFEHLNTSAYDKIFPVYEPLKNYMMFYMPMVQGRGSNYCYCYDTITKSWWLRIVPQSVSIAFRFDDGVYIGTTDGMVLREFKGIDFNGEPIEFSYRTPWFSFGDGTNYLSSREFRVKFDSEHTNHFQIRNRRDGAETHRDRLVTDTKGPVDSLIWDIGYSPSENEVDENSLTDTVWDEFEWVDSGHIVKRFPLPDQFFQTEQIEFFGNSLDDGMAIFGFEFDRVELEEVSW